MSDDDRPGEETADHGPVTTAIATSTMGNAPAFGFSIMITGSFAMINTLAGSPSVLEILLFGIASAGTIGVIMGAVTRGFRLRLREAPPEIRMLGTAQNVFSVAAALGAVAGIGELVGGTGVWPLAAAVGTAVYVAFETAETLLAEIVQRWRGDPEAEQEDPAEQEGR